MHCPAVLPAALRKAAGHGHKPVLIVFRLADPENAFVQIHVADRELQSLRDSEPAPVEHAEKQGIHHPAVAMTLGQPAPMYLSG